MNPHSKFDEIVMEMKMDLANGAEKRGKQCTMDRRSMKQMMNTLDIANFRGGSDHYNVKDS